MNGLSDVTQVLYDRKKGLGWLDPDTNKIVYKEIERPPEEIPIVEPNGKVYQAEDAIKQMLCNERKAAV